MEQKSKYYIIAMLKKIVNIINKKAGSSNEKM
jgi:hypothetical protein